MTSGDDSRSAVRLISINATLRAELVRVKPFLEQRNRPMTAEQMLGRLVQASVVYGIPQREPGEWGVFWRAYLDALDGFTAEALDHAFVRWDRGEGYPDEPGVHRFMPKPADLFRLGQPVRLALGQAAWRAKQALEHIDRAGPAPPTAEERARQRQELIDSGVMVEMPDGSLKVNLSQGMPKAPGRTAPGETTAQLAQRLKDEDQQRRGNAEPGEAI